MTIDDDKLYQAIEKAADAPNHGMREPWRIIHIAKDRLGEMSRHVTRHFQIILRNKKIIIIM